MIAPPLDQNAARVFGYSSAPERKTDAVPNKFEVVHVELKQLGEEERASILRFVRILLDIVGELGLRGSFVTASSVPDAS